MKTQIKISLLTALALLYIVVITPVAVAQTKKEATVKLLASMENFSTLLTNTLVKWEKDVKRTPDGDDIRVLSIKAMTSIIDEMAKVTKEATTSNVDSATKEKVLNSLGEWLTKFSETKEEFVKEQIRREEHKKLAAELNAAIKKLDADIKTALEREKAKAERR
ncbi:MAG: hypothetical protein Q7S86_02560 [bacterium]|nr:hypothetical protein [bacterium]